MDINSLRDAMNKYMMGLGRGSSAAPVDPTTGQVGASQPIDLSTIANLRGLLGMSKASGQAPASLAGPQGSVPRQAIDIEELKRQYRLAAESGDTQRLQQIEEAIRQMQNPGQVPLPPSGGPIGI